MAGVEMLMRGNARERLKNKVFENRLVVAYVPGEGDREWLLIYIEHFLGWQKL